MGSKSDDVVSMNSKIDERGDYLDHIVFGFGFKQRQFLNDNFLLYVYFLCT